jgi:hypothetical protein
MNTQSLKSGNDWVEGSIKEYDTKGKINQEKAFLT